MLFISFKCHKRALRIRNNVHLSLLNTFSSVFLVESFAVKFKQHKRIINPRFAHRELGNVRCERKYEIPFGIAHNFPSFLVSFVFLQFILTFCRLLNMFVQLRDGAKCQNYLIERNKKKRTKSMESQVNPLSV